ncbi:Quinoprotein alcohol dehydrogenase-like protein [Dioscorea alata]|uniref:Quinoprotein alcohol dehydrogenase-like protein n=1 Tax=Dioscorea alata TaxID=55571 RepID=A0ACB7UJM6_DIOAL|nr:Quinoprotein alcohol dehydrogenase-like protein [Dioscorea alata]
MYVPVSFRPNLSHWNWMQVCSTWRAVSRSELLWREVSHLVFNRHRPLRPSWHEEFVRLHRTARNFRLRRNAHHHVLPPSSEPCTRLAVSDDRLAAGFLDGSVALFDLPTCQLLITYPPNLTRERLGRFSQSISGVILLLGRLVFASQDGDVHVADALDPPSWPARRSHVGSLMEDGTLVDFSGDNTRWVGLYAGVPGRSFRIWNSENEQVLFVGGSLTDPDSVAGWHLLTDLAGPSLGRARVGQPGTVMVACTGWRLQAFDDSGDVLNEAGFGREAVVDCVDACEGSVVVVDVRGTARVRQARTLEELCRFNTVRRRDAAQPAAVTGCMNWGYVLLCFGDGVIRVWDAATGEFLYRFRERIGEAGVVVASYRHVAAWSRGTGLHLWDFGDDLFD